MRLFQLLVIVTQKEFCEYVELSVESLFLFIETLRPDLLGQDSE